LVGHQHRTRIRLWDDNETTVPGNGGCGGCLVLQQGTMVAATTTVLAFEFRIFLDLRDFAIMVLQLRTFRF